MCLWFTRKSHVTPAEAGITSCTLHTSSHSRQTSSTPALLKTVFSLPAPSARPSTFQRSVSPSITTERRLIVLRRIRKLGVCSVR
ncbi:hypothetical protein Q7C36_019802 [Tachysurus vachellii]|uniref:Uncharacterized protein n=1 Tax=Tachysurus vachellii TaxID=175792 RepID=A0AA88RYI7_TACVA|nr:hypothetical protein Q7C36_019802 [Tachysurus vachellii]